MPANDVEPSSRDVPPPGLAACEQIMARGETNAVGFGGVICDGLGLIATALDRAPGMDVAGLSQGVDTIGDALQSASTYGTRFAPGRIRDGAILYRPLAYDDGCACFNYTGPVVQAPG